MNTLQQEIACPFCTGQATLLSEDRKLNVKGRRVEAEVLYYQCNDCSEQFTTTESDEITLNNFYSK